MSEQSWFNIRALREQCAATTGGGIPDVFISYNVILKYRNGAEVMILLI